MKIKKRATAADKTPSPLLISLVEDFLTKNGLESTHTSFANEITLMRKKNGWAKASETKIKSDVTLENLLESWSDKQRNENLSSSSTDTASEEESSNTSEENESNSESGSSVSRSSNASTDQSSDSDSSVSESEVKSKKSKQKEVKTKKSKISRASSSSSISESDADDEDEDKDNKSRTKVGTVQKSKNSGGSKVTIEALEVVKKSLKRKAQSISSDSSSEDSPKFSNAQPTKRKKGQVPLSNSSSSSDSSESSTSSSSSNDEVFAKLDKSVSGSSGSSSSEDSSDSETTSDDESISEKPQQSLEQPESPIIRNAHSESSVTIVDDKQDSTDTQSRVLSSATSSDSLEDNKVSQALNVSNTTKRHTGAKPTPLAQLSAQVTADSHISNAYQSYEYAERAYQTLSATRGRNFTKEKNKKKEGVIGVEQSILVEGKASNSKTKIIQWPMERLDNMVLGRVT